MGIFPVNNNTGSIIFYKEVMVSDFKKDEKKDAINSIHTALEHLNTIPASRQRSLAMTKLEEAIM